MIIKLPWLQPYDLNNHWIRTIILKYLFHVIFIHLQYISTMVQLDPDSSLGEGGHSIPLDDAGRGKAPFVNQPYFFCL